MSDESCTAKIKVNIKLEKFDGEYVEGAIPVDVIEREYEFNDQNEVNNFLGALNGND